MSLITNNTLAICLLLTMLIGMKLSLSHYCRYFDNVWSGRLRCCGTPEITHFNLTDIQ